MAQVQVHYQTKELYIVIYILKYRSITLIIYYCVYSGLSDTMEVVIWNFIKFIRNIGFGPWIDKWLE